MEIILIWIPSIFIGTYSFPHQPSKTTVFTGPTLAVLCSRLGLSSSEVTLTFLSMCPEQCKDAPAVKAGRLGSCEGGPRGEEERARKACHWLHTEDICFVPFLITSIWQGPLPPRLTATAEAQWPTAFHIFSYSCPGAFAELQYILLWGCFVLFRSNSS